MSAAQACDIEAQQKTIKKQHEEILSLEMELLLLRTGAEKVHAENKRLKQERKEINDV